MGDISKASRPALGWYGWVVIERNAAWPDYKLLKNTQSWGCMWKAEILESANVTRGMLIREFEIACGISMNRACRDEERRLTRRSEKWGEHQESTESE